MININNPIKCIGCSACAQICPQNCIAMTRNREGFLYPKIDLSRCIHCNSCEKVCYINKLDFPVVAHRPIKVLCLKNKENSIRLASSSGGVFYSLANKIINEFGIVFGVGFNEDFSATHKIVDDVDSIYSICGSKYVQSELNNSYQKVKNYLSNGRKVLFTGTPCQIAALYNFLGGDHDCLYTQEIVCHGVPSPLVWNKYLGFLSSKYKSKINNVSFRYKKYGWHRYMLKIDFSNGKHYSCLHNDDLYMRAFLNNLCLRLSCYSCSFKGIDRYSDITLADGWGMNKILKNFDDDKGLSLVLINTAKGDTLFKNIMNEFVFEVVKIDDFLKYNTSLFTSAKLNKNREKFMQSIIDGMPYDLLKKNFLTYGLKDELKIIIKRFIYR